MNSRMVVSLSVSFCVDEREILASETIKLELKCVNLIMRAVLHYYIQGS